MKENARIGIIYSFCILFLAGIVILIVAGFKNYTETLYESYQKRYNSPSVAFDKTEYNGKEGKRTFGVGKPGDTYVITVVDYFGPDRGYGTIDAIYDNYGGKIRYIEANPLPVPRKKGYFYEGDSWVYRAAHIKYMRLLSKEFQVNLCNNYVPEFHWSYFIAAPSGLSDAFYNCVEESREDAEKYYQWIKKTTGDKDKNVFLSREDLEKKALEYHEMYKKHK